MGLKKTARLRFAAVEVTSNPGWKKRVDPAPEAAFIRRAVNTG